MALHGAMDRIEANGEDAIVHDWNQSISEGVGGQSETAKGDYYDVWVDGKLVATVDSESKAQNTYTRHRSQHPK
jgi:hypothetical protein